MSSVSPSAFVAASFSSSATLSKSFSTALSSAALLSVTALDALPDVLVAASLLPQPVTAPMVKRAIKVNATNSEFFFIQNNLLSFFCSFVSILVTRKAVDPFTARLVYHTLHESKLKKLWGYCQHKMPASLHFIGSRSINVRFLQNSRTRFAKRLFRLR